MVIYFLALIFFNKIAAQQYSQFAHYMHAPSLINPAYAGIDEVMNIGLIYRSQWVGVEGAPTTQAVIFSTPLGKRVGLGTTILRDDIGPANETNFFVDFSYTLPLNNNGLNLSFGIKVGLQLLDVDFSKLSTSDTNDISLENNIDSRISPNVGTGLYLYNNDWYLGVSSPNILSTQHYNNITTSQVNSRTHFYVIGGRNYEINSNFKFKTAFILKAVSGAPIAIDLSLNFAFNKIFTTGISYRHNSAISGLVGIKISDAFSFGYSYGFDTTDISYFNGGSHEVILRYHFNTLLKRISQPTWLY